MKYLVCGDTHGDFIALNKIVNELTPKIVFVCGDFGVWNKSIFFKTENGFFHDDIILPEKTKLYFCDGNHEDHVFLHTLVKKYGWKNPISIRKNIFYCPRGSSLVLDDERRILFFGGAVSTDKHLRTAYLDWFPEEVISLEEYERVDFKKKYDIVISHTCPEMLVNRMLYNIGATSTFYNRDVCCTYLQRIYQQALPSEWYFGHWHTSDFIDTETCKFYALNEMTSHNSYIELV